jgi:hypothetical protein
MNTLNYKRNNNIYNTNYYIKKPKNIYNTNYLGSGERTHENWILRQDPLDLGRVQDPLSLAPAQDPLDLGTRVLRGTH